MEQRMAQPQGLAGLMDDFRRAWQETRSPNATADISRFLVAENDPLRTACLYGLIKVDLEMRWRRGQGVPLEYYLQQFPELGKPEKLPPRVICDEYQIRQGHGDKPALADYQSRFPVQFADVQKLIDQEAALSAGTLLPSFTDTPAPPRPFTDNELLPWSQGASAAPPIPAQSSSKTPLDKEGVLPIGGGYKLHKCIGRGAYGEVWRAEAPGGVEVAIKIIFGSVSQEEAAKREHRALELMKRLRHAYLLPVHAAWQLEDRLVIAMELADSSMRDRFKKQTESTGTGIPAEELIPHFREAAEAVDYLHGNNVLHRDLKPENILLLGGHAKVADFGLARVLEQSGRLMAASTCGTPAFMAPETIQGTSGEASDLYSLAASYVELRLNRPLFQGRSLFELMQETLNTKPDLTGMTEREQEVVHKALAKDPKDRYGSCREFVQALEEALAPERPEALAPPAKTSRLAMVASIVLFLALAASVVVSWYLWNRGELVQTIVPTFELESDPATVSVPAGGITVVTIRAKRTNLTEPIKLTIPHLPAGLRAREFAASSDSAAVATDSEFVIPAERDSVQIEMAAVPDLAQGPLKLDIEATGGEKQQTLRLDITVEPLAYSLPDAWRPAGDASLVRVGKTIYYNKIDVPKGPYQVRFDFIPAIGKRAPDPFYIMQDKVSVKFFREYLKETGAKLPNTDSEGKPLKDMPAWDRFGDDCPVMGIRVKDAYDFAVWMHGNLPSADEWDWAAGRFEKNRGEGPYQGHWNAQDKDLVAVGRLRGPRKIGETTGASVFGLRDMAGNGAEWTRDVMGIPERSVANYEPGDVMVVRSKAYDVMEPLTFKELEQDPQAAAMYPLKPRPYVGFRVVLETR